MATVQFIGMEEAFRKGQTKVENTAGASFKIISDNKPIKGFKSPKFYESKKETGVFIQKNKHRISTPGEKKDITFKGLQSLRLKKAIFGR